MTRSLEGAERIPADAFPVGEFIQDELEARGWTTEKLARRMVPRGSPDHDLVIAQLCVDMLIAVHDPDLLLDEKTARGLARAFGASHEYWMNLDKAWREHPSSAAYRTKAHTP